jgi:acylphosphatase
MIRKRYVVKGKVQGVWFRTRSKEEADNLQLSGFVQNLENGDVLCEAQGESESLAWFEDWLKLGPPMARVEEVTEEILDVLEGEEEFEIR